MTHNKTHLSRLIPAGLSFSVWLFLFCAWLVLCVHMQEIGV